MSDTIIYPRSPRELMAGWAHLPRFIDKIRLNLASRLAPDYQPNFTKGFDGMWLGAAGLDAARLIDVVKGSITDGEVCDWVIKNVHKTAAEKAAFNEKLFSYGRSGDDALKSRFQTRKEQAGLAARADVQTFIDLIDVDEKRM